MFKQVVILSLWGIVGWGIVPAVSASGTLVYLTHQRTPKGYGYQLHVERSQHHHIQFAETLFDRYLLPVAGTDLVLLRVKVRGAEFPLKGAHWVVWDVRKNKWFRLLPKNGRHASGFFLGALYHNTPISTWSDGSLFASHSSKFDIVVHRCQRGNKCSQFLAKFGLYAFNARRSGGFAYVLWGRTGRESSHFVDVIPGKPMQLWWVPKRGQRHQLLARSDAFHRLHFVDKSRRLVYLTPYMDEKSKYWQMVTIQPNTGKVQKLAKMFAHRRSRSIPKMYAWPNSPWVVYPDKLAKRRMVRGYYGMKEMGDLRYVRQHVQTGQTMVFFHENRHMNPLAHSRDGYVLLHRYSHTTGISEIRVLDVRVGHKIKRYQISSRISDALYFALP